MSTATASMNPSCIDRVAGGWESVTTLLGYRPNLAAGGSFQLIATLASAVMRGLGLMALSNEELLTAEVRGNPTGASSSADWSPISLAAASIAATFLEPNPDVVWDDERLASLRNLLDAGPDR